MKNKIFIFFLLITTNIFACICTCIETEIGKTDYENTDLIIKGKVLKIVYSKISDEKIITFKIYKSYKGNSNVIIEVRTHRDEATCGLPINNQDKWLLFVYKENNNYKVSLCDKNVRYNKRPNQDRKSRRVKRRKMKHYIQKIKAFRKL